MFRTGERVLTLSKVGPVPIHGGQGSAFRAQCVTVGKDASGRCFASFVVEVKPTPLAANGQAVGIHLGLASLATTSDGVKVAPPGFLRSALQRLRRLQRNLKHRPRGSNRLSAARPKVAKLHAKAGDRRLGHLHNP